MRRLPKFILSGTFCLLLIGGYVAWGYLHVQKLQLHVGESMRDVLAHNQRANYAPNDQEDNTPILWPVDETSSESFDMTYDDVGNQLRFPHAKLVWARQYAGVVTNVLVSTSSTKLALESLYNDFTQTADLFHRAGWQAQGAVPSLEQVRSGMGGMQPDQVEGSLLQFRRGSVAADLKIKGVTAETANNAQARASYILDVEFSDPALQDAQQKKAYGERMRVNGSINKSLQLSYWLSRTQ